MSRRDREHASVMPVLVVLFALVAFGAIAIRVCYEILNGLGRVAMRYCK